MVDFLLPPSGSRRGTIPTQTLVDALAGEIGGTPQILILDALAEEKVGNRYITWASLYADLVAARAAGVHGAIIIIYSNNSTPAAIPEGTYDLSGVMLIGEEAGYETGFARLNITDAVISVPPILFDGLSLAFTGTTSVSGGYKLTFRSCYVAAEDNPITDEGYIIFEDTTVDGTAAPLLDANATMEVVLRRSCLGSGSLGGDGAYNVALFDTTSIVGTMTGPTVNKIAPSYPGGLSANYNDANVAFTASNARFGPWRSTVVTASPGLSHDAQDKERVLLEGTVESPDLFTVNVPASAVEGTTFTVKNINDAAVVNLAFGNGLTFIEPVGSRGDASISAGAVELPAGGYLTYELAGGAWRIVGEGALA